MGLDVSHDCWHGPYSQFMRWRERLHVIIMRKREAADRKLWEARPYARAAFHTYSECMEEARACWPYDDQSDPINVLMAHSDHNGEIAADMCAPLADALAEMVEQHMPARGTYDDIRPATERFIAGLRLAAAANEPVVFQ